MPYSAQSEMARLGRTVCHQLWRAEASTSGTQDSLQSAKCFVPLQGSGCGPLPLMAMCPRWGESHGVAALFLSRQCAPERKGTRGFWPSSSHGNVRQRGRGPQGLRPSSSHGDVHQRGRGPQQTPVSGGERSVQGLLKLEKGDFKISAAIPPQVWLTPPETQLG